MEADQTEFTRSRSRQSALFNWFSGCVIATTLVSIMAAGFLFFAFVGVRTFMQRNHDSLEILVHGLPNLKSVAITQCEFTILTSRLHNLHPFKLPDRVEMYGWFESEDEWYRDSVAELPITGVPLDSVRSKLREFIKSSATNPRQLEQFYSCAALEDSARMENYAMHHCYFFLTPGIGTNRVYLISRSMDYPFD